MRWMEEKDGEAPLLLVAILMLAACKNRKDE